MENNRHLPLVGDFGFSRREFLHRAGSGFGGIALAALLASERSTSAAAPVIDPVYPLRPRRPHFSAQAKQVIFLYMHGGPSHVDTFDYKPLLDKLDGQPVPKTFNKNDKVTLPTYGIAPVLLGSRRKWQRHGQSGRWVSDLLPQMAKHVDELCFIHSLYSESSNHAPAAFCMNTGVTLNGKPSMGSWITYGLGTENQNLPGFVVLYEVGPFGGATSWGSAFLPSAFQGTRFRAERTPVIDLKPPPELASVQRPTLDVMQQLNERHRAARPGVPDLEGRIASYELAYRMQAEGLHLGDLSTESAATRRLYGLDDPATERYGRMCLLARRLVERGVRFVQCYTGIRKPEHGWDGHTDIKANHEFCARQTDRPVAALLTDLKQRGLLESTLVIWAGEFGRMPMREGGADKPGRQHNPLGFTVWLFGGGVRGGQALGATDDIGLRAEKEPHSVHDFHATILTALGLRPEDLYYEHNGRPERLTGVAGRAKLIDGVLSI
jgi:hypothetical protein